MYSHIFYKTYAPLLYGTILRFTDDREKAMSILETSFGKIYMQLHDYPAVDCRLFTWMLRITLAECKMKLGITGSMIRLIMIA